MKICGIYKITSPSNKIYIGKSIDILKRRKQYSKLYCKTQTHLYNSFIKHGFDEHKFEILCECDRTELNDLEIYYIKLFQSFDSEHGLNLKAGGEGGGTHSKETRLKISEGIKKSEKSFKRGHIPWNKGKTNVYSEDRLNDLRGNKNGAGNKGRKNTEESIARMREAQKGHIPWNKGKKTGKGGSSTSFKKGHTAWNKGIPENEETKRKRLITLKKFYENKKQLVE
jgi:group I intron endonuclease